MCIWGIFKIYVHGSSLHINHAKCRRISQNPRQNDRDTIGGLIKKSYQNIIVYQCEGQLQFDCQRRDLGPVPLLDRSKMCWVANGSWLGLQGTTLGKPRANRVSLIRFPKCKLCGAKKHAVKWEVRLTMRRLIKRPPEVYATAASGHAIS